LVLRDKIRENLAIRDRELESRYLSEGGPNPTTWDDNAALLTGTIVDACDHVLTNRKRGKATFLPWRNSNVNKSRQMVKRAQRTMLRTGDPEDRDAFKNARNSHVSLIRKAKKDCWINFVQEQSIGSNKWGKLTKWLIHGTNGTELVLRTPLSIS